MLKGKGIGTNPIRLAGLGFACHSAVAGSANTAANKRPCPGAESPGRGEANQPLEDIDLRGLARGRSVDPRDLLHDADQLAPFFGGEPLVEEIRE